MSNTMQLTSFDEQIVEAMDYLKSGLLQVSLALRMHQKGTRKLEGEALEQLLAFVEGTLFEGRAQGGLMDAESNLRIVLAEDYGVDGLFDDEDDSDASEDDDEPDETAG